MDDDIIKRFAAEAVNELSLYVRECTDIFTILNIH